MFGRKYGSRIWRVIWNWTRYRHNSSRIRGRCPVFLPIHNRDPRRAAIGHYCGGFGSARRDWTNRLRRQRCGCVAAIRASRATEETIYQATHSYVTGSDIYCPRSFFPHSPNSGGALLLFTSSSSYTRGRSGYSLYSSAKAAVVNLTQALAHEWAEHGVRVNPVNPERTNTPMRSKAFGVEELGTLLPSAEVALRCGLMFLLSDQTGSCDRHPAWQCYVPPIEHQLFRGCRGVWVRWTTRPTLRP